MDISVGAKVDTGPEANVGKLLQMLKAAGSDQPAAKGSLADGAGLADENGNQFVQILQQQIASFLQFGDSEGASHRATKQEFSLALQNLLKEDQSLAGDVLSALQYLMIAGQTLSDAAGENDLSKSGASLITGLTGLACPFQEQDPAHTDQIKKMSATGGKGQYQAFNVPASGMAEGEVEPAVKNENEKAMSVSKNGITLPDEIIPAKQSGNQLDKNMAEPRIASDLKDTLVAAVNAKAPNDQPEETSVVKKILGIDIQATVNAGRTAAPEDPMKATNVADLQAGVLGGYTDAQRKAAAKGQGETPAHINTEGITSEENDSTGSQSSKTGVNLTGANQDNKSHLNLSQKNENSDQDIPGLNAQEASRQDVKKKMSDKSESQPADKQFTSSMLEAQKNIAGKAIASSDEQVYLASKARTEVKVKTAPVEKNPDIQAFNASTAAGGAAAKAAISDISPAQIINRVAAEFRESLTSEGGRVKMTLTPPSLGTLQMDVSVHNSKVRVMLIAENQDVQKVLSGNLESLKGSLQSQGLTIERCDVMMQDRREQYFQGSGGQAFQHDQTARENDEWRQDHQNIESANVLNAQPQARRPGLTGSESISLFA